MSSLKLDKSVKLKEGYKIKEKDAINNTYLYMKDGLIWVANGHRHIGYDPNLISSSDIDWEII